MPTLTLPHIHGRTLLPLPGGYDAILDSISRVAETDWYSVYVSNDGMATLLEFAEPEREFAVYEQGYILEVSPQKYSAVLLTGKEEALDFWPWWLSPPPPLTQVRFGRVYAGSPLIVIETISRGALGEPNALKPEAAPSNSLYRYILDAAKSF
jgi:hypothetical protein